MAMKSDVISGPLEIAIDISKKYICMPSLIILNPHCPASLGSCSRAMLNFGLTDMRIVYDEETNDFDMHKSEESKVLAVGSVDILNTASVYNSIEDALFDINDLYLVSTNSSTLEDIEEITKYKIYNPSQAADRSLDEIKATKNKMGLLFNSATMNACIGESRIKKCDTKLQTGGIISISNADYINFAQAANLILYEIWKRKGKIDVIGFDAFIRDIKNIEEENQIQYHYYNDLINEQKQKQEEEKEDVNALATDLQLDAFLFRLEYQLKISNPEVSYGKLEMQMLNDIFLRTDLTQKELSILHGVISGLPKNISG